MNYLLILISFLFASSPIDLIFRLDDVVLKGNQGNAAYAMVQAFYEAGVPLTVGVVPCDSTDCLVIEASSPMMQLLQSGVQEKKIEVALHGLNHQQITSGGGGV